MLRMSDIDLFEIHVQGSQKEEHSKSAACISQIDIYV